MEKEPEVREINSWVTAIFIALVIYAFMIGGIWIGVVSIVLGASIIGWKDRHKGPFRTKQ